MEEIILITYGRESWYFINLKKKKSTNLPLQCVQNKEKMKNLKEEENRLEGGERTKSQGQNQTCFNMLQGAKRRKN